MRITCTNGNRQNKISGSRISVYADDGELVDRFEVPAYWGLEYCARRPSGYYARRLAEAKVAASRRDRAAARRAARNAAAGA